jgi:hypothetical protein
MKSLSFGYLINNVIDRVVHDRALDAINGGLSLLDDINVKTGELKNIIGYQM